MKLYSLAVISSFFMMPLYSMEQQINPTTKSPLEEHVAKFWAERTDLIKSTISHDIQKHVCDNFNEDGHNMAQSFKSVDNRDCNAWFAETLFDLIENKKPADFTTLYTADIITKLIDRDTQQYPLVDDTVREKLKTITPVLKREDVEEELPKIIATTLYLQFSNFCDSNSINLTLNDRKTIDALFSTIPPCIREIQIDHLVKKIIFRHIEGKRARSNKKRKLESENEDNTQNAALQNKTKKEKPAYPTKTELASHLLALKQERARTAHAGLTETHKLLKTAWWETTDQNSNKNKDLQ